MHFESYVDEEWNQPKLAIKFDYDKSKVDRMKALPFHDPNGPCCHQQWEPDFEFEDDSVEDGAWIVDRDEGSIRLVEQALNCKVPAKFKPSVGDGQTVKFVVPDGYTWFFVNDAPKSVHDQLAGELSYEEPNAQYTDAYKRGTWDGIIRLYDQRKQGAPLGLLDRAVGIVNDMGFETVVEHDKDNYGAKVDLQWNFPHPLRNYQKNSVRATLQQEGGVISLPTGAGKTVTCMNLLYLIGRRSIVMVHTKELLYQWAEEIEEALGIEPGMIGDGKWSEGPITVAIMQTLMSRGTEDLDDDYGVLVFDECHRTSAADAMHQIGMDLDTAYRIGLSATPWRSVQGEELKIEGAIGGTSYEVTAEELIEEGFLAEPDFEIIDPQNHGQQTEATKGMDYHDAYRVAIELDQLRNECIARRASELANAGYKVLVDVNRISQGKLLQALIGGENNIGDISDGRKRQAAIQAFSQSETFDTDAVFLKGNDDTERRQEILDEFENGDLNVLISTIVKEGNDIPNISAIILGSAGKSDISLIQVIGRALRPKNGENARIVDVRDRGKYFGSQFTARQHALEDYYGEYYDLNL